MTALAEPGVSLSPNAALKLDKRQRAMLKEMGVHIWQPLPVAAVAAAAMVAKPVAAPAVLQALAMSPVMLPVMSPVASPVTPPVAINSGASRARIQDVSGSFNTSNQPGQASKTAPSDDAAASAWRIGKLQTLYAESAVGTAARWLILMESPASALHDAVNAFEGDAGKLLDNMLRAAKLHTAGAAWLAPLVRGQGATGQLSGELADALSAAKPDVVLVMGRLAAQAVLQTAEPLNRLRGHIHSLHGAKTIITLEPAYLLRNPLDKAKAWDDLCLAMSLVRPL